MVIPSHIETLLPLVSIIMLFCSYSCPIPLTSVSQCLLPFKQWCSFWSTALFFFQYYHPILISLQISLFYILCWPSNLCIQFQPHSQFSDPNFQQTTVTSEKHLKLNMSKTKFITFPQNCFFIFPITINTTNASHQQSQKPPLTLSTLETSWNWNLLEVHDTLFIFLPLFQFIPSDLD